MVCGDSVATERRIARALAEAGVTLAPRDSPELPGLVGFSDCSDELLETIRDSRSRLRRLAVIAAGEPPSRLEVSQLLSAGAHQVFFWRSDAVAAEVAAHLERWRQVDDVVCSPLVRENLTGDSRPWIALLREIVEVSSFTDVPILLVGESGTGKELVARLVHAVSPPRRSTGRGELVVLDSAAVPASLSESAFFGHVKGSFTGAVSGRDGAFALADGGTLFLDEVGELPPPLQAELMRVVQEGTYKPIGSDRYRKTNFRLVCATNRDLLAEGEGRRFRQDFYYRIAGCTCTLPPLRDRVEDILLLARRFLAEIRGADGPELDAAVEELLVRRDYPGNVRELRHLVSRIALRHVGPGLITLADVPEDERPSEELHAVDWRDDEFERAIRRALARGATLRDITALAGETAIAIAVTEAAGSLQRASAKLGVTPRALQLRRARRGAEVSSG